MSLVLSEAGLASDAAFTVKEHFSTTPGLNSLPEVCIHATCILYLINAHMSLISSFTFIVTPYLHIRWICAKIPQKFRCNSELKTRNDWFPICLVFEPSFTLCHLIRVFSHRIENSYLIIGWNNCHGSHACMPATSCPLWESPNGHGNITTVGEQSMYPIRLLIVFPQYATYFEYWVCIHLSYLCIIV